MQYLHFIAQQFLPQAKILAISNIEEGLIHRTYQVRCVEHDYCLQAIHPKLATDAIFSDYEVVTHYLATHQFPAPQLIHTPEHKLYVEDTHNTRWRLTTWLDGACFSSPSSLQMIQEGAQ
ncbi:MAG: hypothetical protein AAGJ35_09875, partial [Myxococcota bacterium]